MSVILKQQEENLLLRQKLEMSQNALPTTKYDGNGESLQSTHTEGVPQEESTNSVSIPIKNLSNAFLEEMQNKVFDYDKQKYASYLELVKKKKKWFGLGEEKLVEMFPCFSLLVKKYKEKMFEKRSKWERDLMKDGKVESKSLVETKGRMMTSAGQFFLLLKEIKPKEDGDVEIIELFDNSKIKVFIRFLEELGREPCTIRNVLLTLKFIIKSFLEARRLKRIKNN